MLPLVNNTVPEVFFVIAAAPPPIIASIVPDETDIDNGLSVPVLPVILPLVNVSAPILSVYAPAEFNIPPFTVTDPASAKTFDAANETVPAFMFKPPLNVFAPLKAKVPFPALVNELLDPEIMPPIVKVLAFAVTVLLALAPKATVPVPKFKAFVPVNAKSPPQV